MDHEDLKKSLEKDYLLIKKTKLLYLVGGAIAFLVASGVVSFQSALVVVEGHAAKTATEAIKDLKEKAQSEYAVILRNRIDSKGKLVEMDTRLASMSTFEQSLKDIKDAFELGNPWKTFSSDIKDVTKDSEKYEYAVLRNGGFRTLTASGWNSGYRVMTSPYMTGDSGQFTLGGSMWIWDTRDRRDDKGVLHLYYFYTGNGTIATNSGNGLTRADDGGEGKIYRRLRK